VLATNEPVFAKTGEDFCLPITAAYWKYVDEVKYKSWYSVSPVPMMIEKLKMKITTKAK
jgi:hypothetical protein